MRRWSPSCGMQSSWRASGVPILTHLGKVPDFASDLREFFLERSDGATDGEGVVSHLLGDSGLRGKDQIGQVLYENTVCRFRFDQKTQAGCP